ncbi:threonine--tRNA ligase [Buchnera aphidicola]|uniref:threonine--tRNA ligase n=1 Tax=Buchnera aphidicola TaxID=9 RepID=UPI002236FF7A|nr:threonine--tRNA ligase [Buchnera aphidicola]MCW5197627.1 threonine--tRNA ligase [Buchnera aphidicola (Chaitophorus viminalis)]
MPVITFPDGFKKKYKNSISINKILETFQDIQKNKYIAGFLNNKIVDFHTIITKDSKLSFIKKKNNLSLSIINNTFVHLLGYSIKTLWPKIKLHKFLSDENKFYYDFYKKNPLKEKHIALIEKKMRDLIKKKYYILKKDLHYQDLKNILKKLNEDYKIKILKFNFKKNNYISCYFHENHIDFMIDIEAPKINFCKYFKLNKLSGVYLNSDKKNKMIQRISGISFLNKKNFYSYFKNLELKKNFDHRKLNLTLNLFHLQEDVPGMVFWHNNGFFIFKKLKNFIRRKLKKYNYQEVRTPILMNKFIWKKSGHLENYKNLMFSTYSDNKDYCIKPMNCPGHINIFNYKLKSYRDLPIRMSEFGSCHRQEPSGALHGLMRLRNFTQDDAHIFCTKEQLQDEINLCIKMIYEIYNIFSFKKIIVKLSTRPDNRIGDNFVWDQAESILKKVLEKNNILFSYQIGDGAFYGPKIEFDLQDSFNRKWQCGTIQLDFYLPKRLGSFYIDKNNIKKTPVLIHRAALGSLERFIGILLEEYKGYLPIWLSPIQVKIINISQKNIKYCHTILNFLQKENIRSELDLRKKSLGLKIRESTLLKIPYILICGDKEEKNNTISFRKIQENKIYNMNLSDFIQEIYNENSGF